MRCFMARCISPIAYRQSINALISMADSVCLAIFKAGVELLKMFGTVCKQILDNRKMAVRNVFI